MSDANDDNARDAAHAAHFIVCPQIMPNADDSLEEWVNRASMLADMAEQLASSLYMFLRVNVPMLTGPDELPAHLIAGIGVLAKGIRDTGRAQLEKLGTAPLSVEEDQARMVWDRLADPTTPAEERDFLLEILARRLNCPSQGSTSREAPREAEEEWPEVLVTGENEAE